MSGQCQYIPRPETVKVTKEALCAIKTYPWTPSGVITQEQVERPGRFAEQERENPYGEPVPRSLRITAELLEEFGLTKGCPKCEAIKRKASHTVHHSRECRERIESRIKESGKHAGRLADAEQRKTQFLARRVEAAEQSQQEKLDRLCDEILQDDPSEHEKPASSAHEPRIERGEDLSHVEVYQIQEGIKENEELRPTIAKLEESIRSLREIQIRALDELQVSS